jgi:serine/threonine protein kinase
MMNDQNHISKRYEIYEIIEEGGKGNVYPGRETQTGQPVAIKQLKQYKISSQPSLIERFSGEAPALDFLITPISSRF